MAYVGFDKLKKMIAKKGNVSNPGAVAASVARKKYGDKAVQKHAAAGTSMRNETRLKHPKK